MWRSVPVILALLAEVGVAGPRAEMYAPVLQEVGEKHKVDPATLIVLIYGESHWNAGLVNSIGCVGLGQICLSNYPVCQGGQLNSEACQAQRVRLQDGVYNLRTIGQVISANREFCNRKTGRRGKARNLWRHWLPSYGGYNIPSEGVWCGQRQVMTKQGYVWRDVKLPKRLVQYMQHRRTILRAVQRKRK